MFFFALVFGLLSLHARVVLSTQFKLKFPNGAQQCEPVSVSFDAGTAITSVVSPMTLTVLPFNSTPIFIQIPNTAGTPAGVSVTFLPLAAGTNFIASLDDSAPGNIARVSDVIRVLDSPSGNDTCLSPPTENATPDSPFQFGDVVSQCQNFTVNYNTTLVDSAPRVRVFNPNGSTSALAVTSDDPVLGVATYQVSVSRGKEIVILADNGQHFRTTNLLTVSGDAASSTGCLVVANGHTNSTNPGAVMMGADISKNNTGIPGPVIIGTSIGGGIILTLIFAMIWFVFRERRRKREEGIRFDAANLERGEKVPARTSDAFPPVDASSILPEGAVANPAYTFERFFTPSSSRYPRNSLSSWSQNVPEDQKVPLRKQNSISSVPSSTRSRPSPPQQDEASDRGSINSLDIEGMLNMATVQSERLSRQTTSSGPIPFSPTLAPISSSQFLSVPAAVRVRPYPSRGHLRSPSDVPADPIASPTLSNFSIDPFSDDNVKADNSPILRSFTLRSPLSALRTASIGLPSSPSNAPRFSSASNFSLNARDVGTPRRSSRGSGNGDNYGFAR